MRRRDIRAIDAAATHALRQRVLRPGESVEAMAWDGDGDPDAFHVGAFDRAERLIAVGSVLPEEPPGIVLTTAPNVTYDRAWRIRGMAVHEGARNEGVGRAVLDALLAHALRSSGGRALVWCNARLRAVSFYERAAFRRDGEPWDAGAIGPHVVMHRLVTTRDGRDAADAAEV